jgi:hypothetical protein
LNSLVNGYNINYSQIDNLDPFRPKLKEIGNSMRVLFDHSKVAKK